MITILLLSLAGAVMAAVIGTAWYSGATPMGRLHMRFLGFDKLSPEEQQKKIEEAKPAMPKIYAAQLALSVITAFATVYIIDMSVANSVPPMAALGLPVFNWLCFMMPVVGGTILWGNCDRAIAWKKFFFDSLYHLVVILATALVALLFV